MALNQNQFAMATLTGTKVSGVNVITCEFYSASASDTIAAGEAVILSSTTNGLVTKVAKGTGATDLYIGVVLTNPLKESFAVGDRVEIALTSTIVMMTVSAAVTAGAKLQYAYDTGKVATATGSNTVIGLAMENATADAQIIRVFVNPQWLSVGEANTASALGTGTDGESLVGTKSGVDLPFKRIKAGTGITVTAETNDLVIALA